VGQTNNSNIQQSETNEIEKTYSETFDKTMDDDNKQEQMREHLFRLVADVHRA
jgi:hypothetical protein